jgi:hypothetical protein
MTRTDETPTFGRTLPQPPARSRAKTSAIDVAPLFCQMQKG